MKRIIAILFFICLVLTLSAQDISSALRQAQGRFDSGNETGAIEILSNILEKYPDNIEAKTLLEKFNKIINDRSIESDWNETLALNTLEAYKSFRNKHPNSQYDDIASDNIAKRMADMFTASSTYADRAEAEKYVRKGMTKDYVANKWKRATSSSNIGVSSSSNTTTQELFDFDDQTKLSDDIVTSTINSSSEQIPVRKERKYNAKERYKSGSVFYIGTTYDFINYSSLGIYVGGFIKGVNIEANYISAINSTTRIYWNYPGNMNEPSVYDYTPQYIGGKIGYGFRLKNRFRITPQIGSGVLSLEGVCIESKLNDPLATNAYSIPIKCELRVDYSIIAPITLTFKGGYSHAVYSSNLFSLLSSGSKSIHRYANGVTCGIGVSMFF
jgi:hypothetical protein